MADESSIYLTQDDLDRLFDLIESYGSASNSERLQKLENELVRATNRPPSIAVRCMSAWPGTSQAVRPSFASTATGKPKRTPFSGALTFFQLAAPSLL